MTLSGEAILKAPRRIPDTAANPDGVTMRRFERQFADALASTLDKLRRDLMRGTNADNVQHLTHQRLHSREYWQPLQDTMADWLHRIATAGAEFGQEQAESLVFGVSKRIDVTDFALDVGLIDWALANDAAAEWALAYAAELVRGVSRTTQRRIAAEVANWASNAEPFHVLVDRVQGLHSFSPARARSIAVTETTRSYAEGNMTAWRESRVIEGRRWNTANDELVCPICGPRHDMVALMGEDFDGIANPPAHPNCRCWITPAVEIGS